MKEYIERATVEEMLESAQTISDGEYCGYCTEDINLSSIPAADVAPVRHGKWIDNTFCSCCGGFDEDDEGNIIQSFHNYCPNCGARMDKEDEHEAR